MLGRVDWVSATAVAYVKERWSKSIEHGRSGIRGMVLTLQA